MQIFHAISRRVPENKSFTHKLHTHGTYTLTRFHTHTYAYVHVFV